MLDKLGPCGLRKYEETQEGYDLSTKQAHNLAVLIALQVDTIEECTDCIGKSGGLVLQGKDGGYYQNPAISIRNISIRMQLELEDKLLPYKLSDGGDDLDLD